MKVFCIYCSTGCRCCKHENHYRGFYATLEEARRRKDKFLSGKDSLLASDYVNTHYSKYGRYHIEDYEAELISNNRMIVSNKVFPLDTLVLVDDEGNVTKEEAFKCF